MHEVCDLVYKLLYSLRQCLCGKLREIAGSRCKNHTNVKRMLKNSCIPTLPFVKAEHGKKKKELLSIYIFSSKLCLIEC